MNGMNVSIHGGIDESGALSHLFQSVGTSIISDTDIKKHPAGEGTPVKRSSRIAYHGITSQHESPATIFRKKILEEIDDIQVVTDNIPTPAQQRQQQDNGKEVMLKSKIHKEATSNFRECDSMHKGYLTVDEFSNFLVKCGLNGLSNNEISKAFRLALLLSLSNVDPLSASFHKLVHFKPDDYVQMRGAVEFLNLVESHNPIEDKVLTFDDHEIREFLLDLHWRKKSNWKATKTITKTAAGTRENTLPVSINHGTSSHPTNSQLEITRNENVNADSFARKKTSAMKKREDMHESIAQNKLSRWNQLLQEIEDDFTRKHTFTPTLLSKKSYNFRIGDKVTVDMHNHNKQLNNTGHHQAFRKTASVVIGTVVNLLPKGLVNVQDENGHILENIPISLVRNGLYHSSTQRDMLDDSFLSIPSISDNNSGDFHARNRMFATSYRKNRETRDSEQIEVEDRCTFKPKLYNSPFISESFLRRTGILGPATTTATNNQSTNRIKKSGGALHSDEGMNGTKRSNYAHLKGNRNHHANHNSSTSASLSNVKASGGNSRQIGGQYTPGLGLIIGPPAAPGIPLFMFDAKFPPSFEGGTYTAVQETSTGDASKSDASSFFPAKYPHKAQPIPFAPPLPDWAWNDSGDPTRATSVKKGGIVINKKSGGGGDAPVKSGWENVLEELARRSKTGLKATPAREPQSVQKLKLSGKSKRGSFTDVIDELAYTLAKMRGEVQDESSDEDEVATPTAPSVVGRRGAVVDVKTPQQQTENTPLSKLFLKATPEAGKGGISVSNNHPRARPVAKNIPHPPPLDESAFPRPMGQTSTPTPKLPLSKEITSASASQSIATPIAPHVPIGKSAVPKPDQASIPRPPMIPLSWPPEPCIAKEQSSQSNDPSSVIPSNASSTAEPIVTPTLVGGVHQPVFLRPPTSVGGKLVGICALLPGYYLSYPNHGVIGPGQILPGGYTTEEMCQLLTRDTFTSNGSSSDDNIKGEGEVGGSLAASASGGGNGESNNNGNSYFSKVKVPTHDVPKSMFSPPPDMSNDGSKSVDSSAGGRGEAAPYFSSSNLTSRQKELKSLGDRVYSKNYVKEEPEDSQNGGNVIKRTTAVDVKIVKEAPDGRVHVSDLPLPHSFNSAVKRMQAANEKRERQKQLEEHLSYRSYVPPPPPSPGTVQEKAPIKYDTSSSSSSSSLLSRSMQSRQHNVTRDLLTTSNVAAAAVVTTKTELNTLKSIQSKSNTVKSSIHHEPKRVLSQANEANHSIHHYQMTHSTYVESHFTHMTHTLTDATGPSLAGIENTIQRRAAARLEKKKIEDEQKQEEIRKSKEKKLELHAKVQSTYVNTPTQARRTHQQLLEKYSLVPKK